ncbi:hypothetical protein B0H13DRAFT_1968703 [Mycena leptocephala]|nr:hypothetical protein B0H13DRAFT_1968703 [Mycena leptocephala]
MSSKSVDTEKPERSRNAKAQARHRAKRKAYIEELEETFTFEQAAVLPPPLAKIRELEAENARLMRENHDLHRCSPTHSWPGARRPMLPFDVVPRTRNCDDVSPDREYKRRKIDTNGNGEEVYISRPGSSHDVLARPPPLTVPDSPLHPHPHHYDPVTVPVPPRPRSPPPDARPHHNGTSGPALHLPDSPPGRATYDERDHAHAHGQPLSQPYAQHEVGREHGHGHGYNLPPPFKFSHPNPHPHSQSPVDINGNAHGHAGLDAHEHDTHDSWRPYAESERGPTAGAGAPGVGAPL